MLDSAFLVSILVFSVIGTGLWVRCFWRFRTGRNAGQLPCSESPFGLVDVIFVFLMWVVVPGILSSIPMAIWGFPDWKTLSTDQTNLLMLISSIIQLAGCLLAAALLIRKYGTEADIFGIVGHRLRSTLLLAAKAFCMVVPPILLIQWLLTSLQAYEHDTINQLQDHFSVATVLVTWLGAVVVAPLCEELLFRGVLQGWLQRIRFDPASNDLKAEIFGGWNAAAECPVESKKSAELPQLESCKMDLSDGATSGGRDETALKVVASSLKWWMPIVTSSLLFAVIHLGQGLAPVPLFFFGLALGFLYRSSGSLLPSILLHLMLNAFSMFWVTMDAIVNLM